MAKRGRKSKDDNGSSPEKDVNSLLKAIERSGEVVDDADKELVSIALGDPGQSARCIAKVMNDWEKSGASAIFQSQEHLAKYYQAAMVGIFVRYVHLLTKSLDLLTERLDDDEMRAPQYQALAERFGEQLGLVRKQVREVFEPVELPESEAELDQRLLEARNKLGERGV